MRLSQDLKVGKSEENGIPGHSDSCPSTVLRLGGVFMSPTVLFKQTNAPEILEPYHTSHAVR